MACADDFSNTETEIETETETNITIDNENPEIAIIMKTFNSISQKHNLDVELKIAKMNSLVTVNNETYEFTYLDIVRPDMYIEKKINTMTCTKSIKLLNILKTKFNKNAKYCRINRYNNQVQKLKLKEFEKQHNQGASSLTTVTPAPVPAPAPIVPTHAPIAPAPVPIAPVPAPAPIVPTHAPIAPTHAPIAPAPVPIAPASRHVPAPVPIAPVPVPIAPAPVPIAPAPVPNANMFNSPGSIFTIPNVPIVVPYELLKHYDFKYNRMLKYINDVHEFLIQTLPDNDQKKMILDKIASNYRQITQ